MAKLPFVVQPRLKPIIERIGSEDSGVIEIERRGFLTSGEKTFVQQIQQQDGGTMQLVALSRKVAQRKDISLEKAYNNVLEIMTGQGKSKLAKEIENEFAEDFQLTLNSLTTSRIKEDLVQAACLLIHRVDSSLQFTDILEVHPDIISGLSELYREEEAKSIERLASEEAKKDEVNVDAIEKKPEETAIQ